MEIVVAEEISKKQTEHLRLANQIANLRLSSGRTSARAQRLAFCLLLFAAGAAVFLVESSFRQLEQSVDELAQELDDETIVESLMHSKLAARKRQDEDFSFFPGLCACFLEKEPARVYPGKIAQIAGDSFNGSLTRAFAEAVLANDEYRLPTFQTAGCGT